MTSNKEATVELTVLTKLCLHQSWPGGARIFWQQKWPLASPWGWQGCWPGQTPHYFCHSECSYIVL